RPHAPAGERLARPDDDRVRPRLGAEGVERLRRGDAETPPLARREAPEALVLAELGARCVDDPPGCGTEPVPREEVAVVAAGEEARLLALGTPGDREPGRASLRPRLVLRALAEGEGDPLEEPRVEAREHVRLILALVCAAREEQAAVVVDDPRVVARGESIGAGAPREGEPLRPAERAVP